MPIATSAQQATDRTPMYNCFFFMPTKVRFYHGDTAYIHLKISKDFANPIIFMCWDNIKRHLNVFFVSKIWENRKFCLILRMIRGLCYSL